MSRHAAILRRWTREQRGSYVAQTAGIALFVAVVITILLGAMPGMRGRVQQLLECEIGKYSGGGGCGSGGSAQNGRGPDWQVYPSAPINGQPQPDGQPQPVANAPQPEPQPVRRCDEGMLAGTTSGATPVSARTTRPQAAPAPQTCDARCQLLGFLDGMGDGVWDTLSGLWSLGGDAWKLLTRDAATLAKYQTLLEAFRRNPVAVARELLGALAEPIIADWNAGCYGRASGRLLFEVLTTVGGSKGLDKLAKIGLLDELGDAGKFLRRVPCLGATPTGKAPGLAKLVLSCWVDVLFQGRSAAEIAEMRRLMAAWDAATFESVAHSIAFHAAKHGDGDVLKYLRRAASFNKKGARRIQLPDGAIRYEKGNGEFLIERGGKVITYGRNE